MDLNCLFWKGLLFKAPEMVPFRLTQNMVDALGLTGNAASRLYVLTPNAGYEGVYRHVCEITMQIMRTHRDALITVLETFIYDPFVDWKDSSSSSKSGEVENADAKKTISVIEQGLNGIVR